MNQGSLVESDALACACILDVTKQQLLTWQEFLRKKVLLQGALTPLQDAGHKKGQLGVPQLVSTHPNCILVRPTCAFNTDQGG